MNSASRMTRIQLERERLLARCESQRVDISGLAVQWEKPLNAADRVLAGVNYLRKHPVALGGAVALLVIVRRRGWWNWARRGYMLWRAYRAFSNSGIKATI